MAERLLRQAEALPRCCLAAEERLPRAGFLAAAHPRHQPAGASLVPLAAHQEVVVAFLGCFQEAAQRQAPVAAASPACSPRGAALQHHYLVVVPPPHSQQLPGAAVSRVCLAAPAAQAEEPPEECSAALPPPLPVGASSVALPLVAEAVCLAAAPLVARVAEEEGSLVARPPVAVQAEVYSTRQVLVVPAGDSLELRRLRLLRRACLAAVRPRQEQR